MVGNALASLSACTLRGGGDEGRSATGLVTVECHRDAIDQHLGVSFNDYANSMTRHRASAAVTLTGDGYTEDFGASRCADDDLHHGSWGRSGELRRACVFLTHPVSIGIALRLASCIMAQPPPWQERAAATTSTEPRQVWIDRPYLCGWTHHDCRWLFGVGGACHQHILA